MPADLATIYDYNPLYRSGNAGQGQTVILLERTDLFSNADYTTFRKTFGLNAYKNSKFSVVHPGGCTDPGVLVGDDGEAAVDVEWAAASAPAADIELASCADTVNQFRPVYRSPGTSGAAEQAGNRELELRRSRRANRGLQGICRSTSFINRRPPRVFPSLFRPVIQARLRIVKITRSPITVST